MFGYIYKTTNLINGKIYIGMHHGDFDPHYRGSGKLLKYAISKYGLDNFRTEIIEECHSIEMINECEIYWISKLNTTDRSIGYNILEGGINGYQKNIHNTRKGKKLSKEICEKMSIGMKGKKKSKEHCINISKGRKGLPCSEEAKRKISESLRRKYKNGEMVHPRGNKGYIWVTNIETGKDLMLPPNEAIELLNSGIYRAGHSSYNKKNYI